MQLMTSEMPNVSISLKKSMKLREQAETTMESLKRSWVPTRLKRAYSTNIVLEVDGTKCRDKKAVADHLTNSSLKLPLKF